MVLGHLPELEVRLILSERLRWHEENIFTPHFQRKNMPGGRGNLQFSAYFYADILGGCVFRVWEAPVVALVGGAHR